MVKKQVSVSLTNREFADTYTHTVMRRHRSVSLAQKQLSAMINGFFNLNFYLQKWMELIHTAQHSLHNVCLLM